MALVKVLKKWQLETKLKKQSFSMKNVEKRTIQKSLVLKPCLKWKLNLLLKLKQKLVKRKQGTTGSMHSLSEWTTTLTNGLKKTVHSAFTSLVNLLRKPH